jgi:hypothetical protein
MKIVNTYIVCRITNTIFNTPKFYKVHEIDLSTSTKNSLTIRYGYIKEDNGELYPISKEEFDILKENMNLLGL